MSASRDLYAIEVTDTYGGDPNYSWVRRYQYRAKSPRGAISAHARQHGAGWTIEYDDGDCARYNLRGAAICAFVTLAESN